MPKRSVNIAYYRAEDWLRLRSIIDDKDSFHDSWSSWKQEYEKVRRGLKSQGFIVNEVVVDLDELIRFCFQNGIKNDGQARSRFVSQIRTWHVWWIEQIRSSWPFFLNNSWPVGGSLQRSKECSRCVHNICIGKRTCWTYLYWIFR